MSQDRGDHGALGEDEQKKGDGTGSGDGRRLPQQMAAGTDLFGNPIMPAASDQSQGTTGDTGSLFNTGTKTGSSSQSGAKVSVVTYVVAGLCALAIFVCAGLIGFKMLSGQKDAHSTSATTDGKTDGGASTSTAADGSATGDLTANQIYKKVSPSVVTLQIITKAMALKVPKCKLIDPFGGEEPFNQVMAYPDDDGTIRLYQKGKQVEKALAILVLPNGDKSPVLVMLDGKKALLVIADGDGKPVLKGGHAVALGVPARFEVYGLKGTGTGFYVRPDIVATNWHVVSVPAMGDAGFNGGSAQITDKPGKYTITDKPIAFDKDHDLALLYVPGTEAQPVTLEPDYSKLRVGEPVYALGSPWGLAGSLSEGIVSSDELRSSDDSDHSSSKLYIQHSAKIDHGFSGGPLLDAHGHVIGVDTAHKGNGAVNLSVAARYVQDLLDKPSTQAQIEKLSKSAQVDLHG